MAAADRWTELGQLRALVRREGTSASHLSTWRSLRKPGQLRALPPQPCVPTVIHTPEHEERSRLQREHAPRLRANLTQAAAIIEMQKKVSVLLGLPPAEP